MADLATRHLETRTELADRTAALTRHLWGRVDPQNISASWLRLLPTVVELVTQQQTQAVGQSAPYLAAVLKGVATEGRINTAAFTGVAMDGRPLAGLFMYPVWSALGALRTGSSVADALSRGAGLIDLMAHTVIADTGRTADQVGTSARPKVVTYVRVVEGGACARCLVLAGNEYHTNHAFLRHPKCNCTSQPVRPGDTPDIKSPMEHYDDMSPAQRRRTFGEAGAKALADGADIGQVVNARRGMKTVTGYGERVQTTTEGTTKRGIAGARLGDFAKQSGQQFRRTRNARLMPAQIYENAGDNRAMALELLHKYGYLI